MNEPGIARALDEELDWLAFCFVTGELSGDERSSFECRLSEDQSAREAVARAVELMQAISLAQTHEDAQPVLVTNGRRTTTWPRRLAWMSVGASAALVLVAAWLQFDAIARLFSPPPVDRQELAEVWSRTRETVRDIVQSEPYEFSAPVESDLSSDDAFPSWISAAVFIQPSDADPDGSSTHDES